MKMKNQLYYTYNERQTKSSIVERLLYQQLLLRGDFHIFQSQKVFPIDLINPTVFIQASPRVPPNGRKISR